MKIGPMPIEEIHARNVAAGVIYQTLPRARVPRGGLLPADKTTGDTLGAPEWNDLVDRVNALTLSGPR